jgi:hypothetical protein
MRKIEVARGTPKERGKLVTRMKVLPLRLRLYPFAASDADVDEAGYSPPVPKPVMPRAMVNIQNMPEMVYPLAEADRTSPRMIIDVVKTRAVLRPM